MDLELKVELRNKIAEWLDGSYEHKKWPSIYVGENIYDLMTDAAASVFDAVVDVQDYLKEDGQLLK